MKLFYGWVIVGVGIVVTCLGFGAMLTISIFLQPMATAMGWSRTGIATAAMLNFLCMGAGAFIWGALSDRYGTRMVVMGGSADGDEFNWAANRHAVEEVRAAGFALEVVPLEVTTQVPFDDADAAALERAGATTAAALLRARLQQQEEIAFIHDAVAAAVLLQPELVDAGSIDVDSAHDLVLGLLSHS